MANVTRFFLVVLVVGVLMGLAMAGTDLFNPVRSPAEAALTEVSVARLEHENAIALQQQALLTKAETEALLAEIQQNSDYESRLLDGDIKLQRQLDEQERQWANVWNVVGLVLAVVIAAILVVIVFMFSVVGVQRLSDSRPRTVWPMSPAEATASIRPMNTAQQPPAAAQQPIAARPPAAAAQPGPIPPATACANPPRPVNPPPQQPSPSPAGLNPTGPRGARPNGNQPPIEIWTHDRRRDAVRQAREQEQAERMLKILIDNRMDNSYPTHGRRPF